MKRFTIGLIAVVVLTFAVITAPAFAKTSASKNACSCAGQRFYPGVVPPNAKPYGLTYGEWGARWWQWVFSLPTPVNPLYDTTGANAAAGQHGPVWFLAGTFTGGDASVARTVTIPAGKALLIPIVNVEGSLADTPQVKTYPEVVALCEQFMDSVTIADLTVDGRLMRIGPNTRYRTGLVESWYTLPEDNILGLAPGTYAPVAYDGYYAMLKPLSVGRHVIKIHGRGVWFESIFDTQATYNLTVGHKART